MQRARQCNTSITHGATKPSNYRFPFHVCFMPKHKSIATPQFLCVFFSSILRFFSVLPFSHSASLPFYLVHTRVNTTRHWKILAHTHTSTHKVPFQISSAIPVLGPHCVYIIYIPYIPLRFNVSELVCVHVRCVDVFGFWERVIWRTYHIQCNNGKQRQTLMVLRICVPCSANITNGKKVWWKKERRERTIFSM